MKKTIFSGKASEEAVENLSVERIAEKLGVKLTYSRYPTISDEEIELWDSFQEPWNIDLASFKRAFSEFLQTGGE